jgi:hypothetical protein
VGYLHAGVDAAIGSAGAGDADRGTSDRSYRGFQRVLHRAAAGLGLPAEKATAVVLQS